MPAQRVGRLNVPLWEHNLALNSAFISHIVLRETTNAGAVFPGECDAVQKRLYRSRRDHIIAGIAGGLGEYFDVDPTIVRLVMLLLVFPGGAGLFLYIIGWVIIPPELGHESEPTTMFAKSEALRRRMLRGAKQVEARLQGRKEEQTVDQPAAEQGEQVGAADVAGAPTPNAEPGSSASMSVSGNSPDGKTGGDEAADSGSATSEEEAVGGPPDTTEEDERARRQKLGGFVLIGVGCLFVLRDLLPALTFGSMWPLFIIGLGVLLILRGLSE